MTRKEKRALLTVRMAYSLSQVLSHLAFFILSPPETFFILACRANRPLWSGLHMSFSYNNQNMPLVLWHGHCLSHRGADSPLVYGAVTGP